MYSIISNLTCGLHKIQANPLITELVPLYFHLSGENTRRIAVEMGNCVGFCVLDSRQYVSEVNGRKFIHGEIVLTNSAIVYEEAHHRAAFRECTGESYRNQIEAVGFSLLDKTFRGRSGTFNVGRTGRFINGNQNESNRECDMLMRTLINGALISFMRFEELANGTISSKDAGLMCAVGIINGLVADLPGVGGRFHHTTSLETSNRYVTSMINLVGIDRGFVELLRTGAKPDDVLKNSSKFLKYLESTTSRDTLKDYIKERITWIEQVMALRNIVIDSTVTAGAVVAMGFYAISPVAAAVGAGALMYQGYSGYCEGYSKYDHANDNEMRTFRVCL